RLIAHSNGETILASRSGKTEDFNQRFAHIKAELDQLTVACILDGEIVSLDEEGRSQFHRLHAGETADATFVVFDLLAVQGPNRELADTRHLPLRERKELLREVIDGLTFVKESPVFEDGEELLEYARQNDLEGIVAKRSNSIYKEDARNDNW